MKKITFLAFAIIFSITTNSYTQNSNIGYGIKAGANYSKFTPDLEVGGRVLAQYQRKPGFYLGSFLNMEISKRLQFQPELLFALQGTNILIEGIELQGGFESSPTIVDFESRINESTIVVPLVFRYLFTGPFFLEAGPQLGYIINRNEKITKVALEQPNEREERELDYDKFDLGLTVGAGYNLTKDLTLNSRFFLGLIKRNNIIKTSILNLGLEYKL